MTELAIVIPAGLAHFEAITQKEIEEIYVFINVQRNPKTRKLYEQSLLTFFRFAQCRPAEITQIIAVRYQEYLEGKYKSLHTIRTHVNIAKTFCRSLFEAGILHENPFRHVKARKPAEITSERILSEEDVVLLINAPTLKRDRVFLRTIYKSGLRVSEACNLKWTDLSAENVITLHETKSQEVQHVTITKSMAEMIRAIRKESNSPYIFPSRQGHKPISRQRAHQIIKRAASTAGINERASIHWLRHSHGTHAARKGASLVVVRDTLRHKNIETTNKYLHSSPQDSSAFYLDD